VHEPVERWLQATQHHFALQRELPAQQAQVVDGNPPVAPEMRARMHLLGISRLYVHQAAALDHVAAGEHLLVTTGTASGKSLCYNLPVCAKLLGKDQATALYIFPTKALAQDQARRAAQWLPGPAAGKGIVIYDGDTAKNKRAALRRKARVLITNPDMLHVAILARHTVFKDFFRKLAFVVVDEIHSYGGVFGSHVANLFERLRRVSRFYGSKPRFIMASATIANGAKLAGWLAGERVQVVNRDGAAKPRRVLLAINPPLLDKRLGIREDYLRTTLDVVGELLQQGIRTLVFVQSRRQVEQLIRTFKDGLATPHVVSGYHAGYLPGERRDIESRWRQGGLQVLVATSALELGMDIGDVQAVVLAGYPAPRARSGSAWAVWGAGAACPWPYSSPQPGLWISTWSIIRNIFSINRESRCSFILETRTLCVSISAVPYMSCPLATRNLSWPRISALFGRRLSRLYKKVRLCDTASAGFGWAAPVRRGRCPCAMPGANACACWRANGLSR